MHRFRASRRLGQSIPTLSILCRAAVGTANSSSGTIETVDLAAHPLTPPAAVRARLPPASVVVFSGVNLLIPHHSN